ncbi:MAG: ATP-binding domain-containing protein [Firmicutes bacterium]|nr:ATP-binding domain-containing protein [Bacillota bacterium]
MEGLRRAFLPLAEEGAELRREVGVMRPPALLDRVLERSGLLRYYSDDPRRLANLEELRRVFVERDDPAAEPLSSLEGILTFSALARNVDRLGPEDDRVRVLTVHQAKGLEFDVVVVAGLSDNEFPNYGSIKDGRELEERRLLYVALTRARRYLILTGHARRGQAP